MFSEFKWNQFAGFCCSSCWQDCLVSYDYNLQSLLVGMFYAPTYTDPIILLLGIMFPIMKILTQKLFTAPLSNRKDKEPTQMSKIWIDKEVEAYMHNKILNSYRKKVRHAVHSNLNWTEDMLSEIIQRHKDKHRLFLLMCGIWRSKSSICTFSVDNKTWKLY